MSTESDLPKQSRLVKRRLTEVVSQPNFMEGDYVRLKANPDEGFPEEFGVVEWDEGEPNAHGQHFYTVKVDDKYREGPEDDGVREVTSDQMELVRRGVGVNVNPQSAGTSRVRNYLKSRGKDQRN